MSENVVMTGANTVRDYLAAVLEMLGPGGRRFADAAAWARLERRLGVHFPGDYKAIIDEYAPVQVNGHVFLSHPATERWNLGEWIEETEEAFRMWDWAGLGDPVLGSPKGLIPLCSSDRAHVIFGGDSLQGDSRPRLVVHSGEGETEEYAMGFAEWLYRYLIGEEMLEPGLRDYYLGPVKLEWLPMSAGHRTSITYGPDRGM